MILPLDAHSTLNIRVPTNEWWAALRYFDTIVSALVIVSCIKQAWIRVTRLTLYRNVFFLGWGGFTLVQELEQIGQPVLVWRAPTIAFLNIIALGIIWERGKI